MIRIKWRNLGVYAVAGVLAVATGSVVESMTVSALICAGIGVAASGTILALGWDR